VTRLVPICNVLALLLLVAVIAAAQATSVSGQIIAPNGEPWADIDVLIQNTNTGQRFDVKTDKNGRFAHLGCFPVFIRSLSRIGGGKGSSIPKYIDFMEGTMNFLSISARAVKTLGSDRERR